MSFKPLVVLLLSLLLCNAHSTQLQTEVHSRARRCLLVCGPRRKIRFFCRKRFRICLRRSSRSISSSIRHRRARRCFFVCGPRHKIRQIRRCRKRFLTCVRRSPRSASPSTSPSTSPTASPSISPSPSPSSSPSASPSISPSPSPSSSPSASPSISPSPSPSSSPSASPSISPSTSPSPSPSFSRSPQPTATGVVYFSGRVSCPDGTNLVSDGFGDGCVPDVVIFFYRVELTASIPSRAICSTGVIAGGGSASKQAGCIMCGDGSTIIRTITIRTNGPLDSCDHAALVRAVTARMYEVGIEDGFPLCNIDYTIMDGYSPREDAGNSAKRIMRIEDLLRNGLL